MGAVQAAELTAGGPGVAKPKEFQFGEVTVRTKGTMTYGTIIRADDRNPELVPYGNGVAVGVNGTARGGTNNDDGELNYGRGDHTSTVLKAVLDADLKFGNVKDGFGLGEDAEAERTDHYAGGEVAKN